MKKIISYNVNGLRAAIRKGLMDWIKESDADIICFQEIKAKPEQIPILEFEEYGYLSYWFSAVKPGYSGVAVLTKIKPDAVVYGMEIEKYNYEGRIIRLEFGDVSLINVYHPSGTSGEIRQAFKIQWLEDFYNYINELKKEHPKLVIVGDFNIAHTEIDIHNPVSNANKTGFLPEERAWVTKFLSSGFIDSFRYFNKESHQYTWWSQRTNARDRNLGWRLDYEMVTANLEKNMISAGIHSDVKHSDHCPVSLTIDF